ncbi:unnamed protein product [Symbiodinium necroappetens]|uniref:C3H1-type domain-containing protein n=1 Tax=Symbiodinium necroappetens TaxID=1628268 RepID=A0A812ZLF8_9DINO|nr:unnamed protein product [Symbiodinium necroappetens]CAE7845143.1 unnamed protein product [Symbiodinium microadriaticum]CAE7939128.1 unnamed protein product [Symbiodinium sp. KB8]|mmetsp:Transcript_119482/g.283639  ORF Transcript_119482/g.283639 Transcript_119482/m.283639 type:complete len:219 (+) Transcript_119482:79-735(+)
MARGRGMPSPFMAGESSNPGALPRSSLGIGHGGYVATSRPSSSAGPSISQNLGQMGHSMKIPIPPKSGMPSATPIAKCAAEPPDMLQLHLAGKCYPCVAYALKPAGCFKGAQCMHCHFCNAKEAKARRRELQQAARRRKRRENALKDHGDEGEGDEDQDQFDVNANEQHASSVSDPQVSDKPAEQARQLPSVPRTPCPMLPPDVQPGFGGCGKQSFWL